MILRHDRVQEERQLRSSDRVAHDRRAGHNAQPVVPLGMGRESVGVTEAIELFALHRHAKLAAWRRLKINHDIHGTSRDQTGRRPNERDWARHWATSASALLLLVRTRRNAQLATGPDAQRTTSIDLDREIVLR